MNEGSQAAQEAQQVEMDTDEDDEDDDDDVDDENTNQSESSNNQAGSSQLKEPEKEKSSAGQPSSTAQRQQQQQLILQQQQQNRGRRHTFFQRSESTLCLGCPPPDPFQYPLQEALPLADQPQLLQPNARREDMFGTPKPPVAGSNFSTSAAHALSVLPAKLGLVPRKVERQPTSTNQQSLQIPKTASSSAPSFQGGTEASQVNFDRMVIQQR